ncbi:UDP-N-acetylmuramoyl-L-alanyl-D-glutamate--2,6-diaminopimelate ligase [Elioraea thermophila]|uniref:UDP-N-acetylmuramoyl-L-alanyl-D-glutamate--2, 6-diaminopimelate ligase n=1 Tax=Elioraea thermophila TaxID=2185104 RepID=UPI000DF3C878|nr:UDP-N-acetylmuramoyl-L-alanyl-D-glutamate--2,6-diaminopimelate ligase [Elioraea thermophila]
MRLADLMHGSALPATLEGRALEAARLAAFEVTGLTADSRRIRPGDLFAALPGTKADGRAFIAEAVAKGAVAVLAPEGTAWPPGVPPRPLILDPDPRRRFALMCAAFHGAQPATVVAVTGTNGKTSTVDFLRQIFAALHDGKAASLGTLGLIAPGFAPGASLTTPDPASLHETLAALARAGIAHAAMEASSHGLDQRRLDGVRLAAAAFTTFTRDHLDYHGTMAAYLAAKLRLFEALLEPGRPVVAPTTLAAEATAALREVCARRGLVLHTVGRGGSLIEVETLVPLAEGTRVALHCRGERFELILPLVGFQAENALTAAALAIVTGSEPSRVFAILPRLAGVRGRIERVATLANGAAVYVDYAHTPDAIAAVLAALRPHCAGRLTLVFGAGGDRDPGKRTPMGEAACTADRIIVTDDNPRSEDPAAIRAAVRAGCPQSEEIGDRAAAIAAAIAGLGPGDVAVIAGKGHEQGQIVGDRVIPFDDAAIARDAVERLGGRR